MLFHFILSIFIFTIGFVGLLSLHKHLINILIYIELILISININFIIISFFIDDILGQIYSIMVLTIAAGDSAIGLCLIILYYKIRGGIFIDIINILKC